MSFIFHGDDSQVLTDLCQQARKHCKNNPARSKVDCITQNADFHFGDWHLVLIYMTFTKPKPVWNASISRVGEVGIKPHKLESGLIVELPEEGLVSLNAWTDEHLKEAQFLLGELLGSEDKGDSQRALEHKGLFSLHWLMESA